MMPTFIVVAVSPTSVPGAADVAGEAADEVAAADGLLLPLLLLLLAELHPAASRTAAASAAVTPRKRARAGNGRLARLPAPPGLSLLAVTLVASTTSLPVSFDPGGAYTGRSVEKQRRTTPPRICAGDLLCLGRTMAAGLDLYIGPRG
jgi:hypothetical protein